MEQIPRLVHSVSFYTLLEMKCRLILLSIFKHKQVYSIDGSDQCLIGTAEIPVGGIHMDSILSASLLPLKYVAVSHCFRTEAGAAGTATR